MKEEEEEEEVRMRKSERGEVREEVEEEEEEEVRMRRSEQFFKYLNV